MVPFYSEELLIIAKWSVSVPGLPDSIEDISIGISYLHHVGTLGSPQPLVADLQGLSIPDGYL